MLKSQSIKLNVSVLDPNEVTFEEFLALIIKNELEKELKDESKKQKKQN